MLCRLLLVASGGMSSLWTCWAQCMPFNRSRPPPMTFFTAYEQIWQPYLLSLFQLSGFAITWALQVTRQEILSLEKLFACSSLHIFCYSPMTSTVHWIDFTARQHGKSSGRHNAQPIVWSSHCWAVLSVKIYRAEGELLSRGSAFKHLNGGMVTN